MRYSVPVAVLTMVLAGCGAPASSPPAAPVNSSTEVKTSAPPTSSTPAPAPTQSAPPPAAALTLADTVPDGSWEATETVVSNSKHLGKWFSGLDQPGSVLPDAQPMVFSSTCSDTSCEGTITRASDAKHPPRDFTWDGTNLVITRPVWKDDFECLTDGVPNGARFKWAGSYTYTVEKIDTDPDGRVVGMVLTSKTTYKGDKANPKRKCGSGLPAASQSFRVELTQG